MNTKFPGNITLYDMITERVSQDFSDRCWLWEYTLVDGYGVLQVNGKGLKAHRVSYELRYGSIPVRLQLDHIVCDTRACWNPGHTTPVTQWDNIHRGQVGINNRAKTHCPSGHEYAGDNLHIDKNGSRVCRECKRLWMANNRAAIRG